MKKLASLAAALFLSMTFDAQLNSAQGMVNEKIKQIQRKEFREAIRPIVSRDRRESLITTLRSDQTLIDRLVEHADDEILARFWWAKESLRTHGVDVNSLQNDTLLKWVVNRKISEKKFYLKQLNENSKDFQNNKRTFSMPTTLYELHITENLDLDSLYREYLKLHIEFAIEFDIYRFASKFLEKALPLKQ